MGDRYDIFFSYAHADKDAVKPVLAALFAQGLRVFHDETDITDGQSITRRVTEGLTGARMLVAWYSKTYPTRRACQWELTAAIIAAQGDTSDKQAIERRILPLNPELSVDHIQPVQIRVQSVIPTNGVDPTNLASRVAARLTGLSQTFGQLHHLTRPNWYGSNARLGSNRFVGRVSDLWVIHSGLSQHNFAMITGSNTGLVQVQGMGGIGKTLLAEEYALRFAAAYPGGIFWLSAVAGESLSTQILRVADHLGLATANLTPDQVAGLLRGTLSSRGRYLWVVDDLPADADHNTLLAWSAPSVKGVTLVTTRNKRLNGSGFIHPLDVLSPEEAFELLTSRRPPRTDAEQSAAQEILTLLGNHALAVDVTGAAIEAEGYQFICDLLRSPQEDALEFAAELADDLPGGHAPSIAATLLASIRRLNEDGLRLLHLAALLAPVPIPRSLIASVFTLLAEDEHTGRKQAALGIKAATNEALAERIPGADDAADAVSVHVLVSRTIHFHVEASPYGLRENAVLALIERMENSNDIRNHSTLHPLVPHARNLTKLLPDPETAALLGWLGRLNLERAAYAKAEEDYSREWQAKVQLLGAEHPYVLTCVSNIAEARRLRGDFPGARAMIEGVLPIMYRIQGEQHPNTLMAMNNLGAILLVQGDYLGAQEINEKVLSIRRKVLGEDHPDTLMSKSNLGSMLLFLGELSKAKEIQLDVVESYCRILGAEHPSALISVNTLATIMHAEGDLVGARQIFKEVLCIRKKLMGDEHPDTLGTMISLAETLQAQGHYAEARILQESSLQIQIRNFGSEHPLTLVFKNNFAKLLRLQGENIEARKILEDVVMSQKEMYGDEHPSTLASMANLANMLMDLNEFSIACQLNERIVALMCKTRGKEHPETLTSMNNWAETLRMTGEIPRAQALHMQVLEASSRILGIDHPSTLRTLANLGIMLIDADEIEEARDLVSKALLISMAKYGPGPDFSQALINLAKFLNLPLPLNASQQ